MISQDDITDNIAEESPHCMLYKDRNCKGCPYLEDFEEGKLIEEIDYTEDDEIGSYWLEREEKFR